MAPGGSPAREDGGPGRYASIPLLAVLGLLGVLLSVALAVTFLGVRRDAAARAEAAAAAERAAAELAEGLQRIEAAVEHLPADRCAVAGGSGDATSGPVLATQRVAEVSPPPGTQLLCLSADLAAADAGLRAAVDGLRADEAVRVALAESRDRRIAVLAAGAPADGRAVMAAAVYRDGDQLRREPSGRSLADLRSALVGHVVALIDVPQLVDLDGRWEVLDGEVELARSGSLGDEMVEAQVAALDRRWTLRSDVPGPGWWLPVRYSVAFSGISAVVLIGLADRERRRQLERHAAAAARADHRSGVIRALVGVVQHSHDVGEILPALAVRLSDELRLAGLSLSLDTGRGAEREVFVHGAPPDRDVRPSPGRIEAVPAGATLALDLHRADRSIAVLRVVAGEPLDSGDLDLLQLASEMVTSTIVAARSLEQQQEVVARLQSLDELKTTFLGVASHELRTPATAISGLATLLADRWDALADAERHAFAARIATNADSLNGLVQDLLDFARLERGDLELALAPVEVGTVVDALLDRLEGVWASHHVERRIEPGIVVLGDGAAIERVVTNLVSNAAKFAPDGSTVTVSVSAEDGRAQLVVDDAGPGVPEDERDKVFVRFFRGAGDAVVRTRGVGIGLSVVQDFVAQMGGDVRVGESPAGGARFLVELPLHDRTRPEVPDAANA